MAVSAEPQLIHHLGKGPHGAVWTASDRLEARNAERRQPDPWRLRTTVVA
jgi:hypothetical protein